LDVVFPLLSHGLACIVAVGAFCWALGAQSWGEKSMLEVTDAQNAAKVYRVLLLENKIDPDTGKPWAK
jgi:hypothetical protein